MRALIATLLGCALLLAACGSVSTGAVPAKPTQPSNPAPSQPTQPPVPTGVPDQPLLADTPVPQPTATPALVTPSPTVGDAQMPTATLSVPVVVQGKETPMPTPDPGSEPVRPMPPYNAQPLTPPFGTVMDAQIDAAKQDLAQRLGIDTSAIEVVEVAAVTWPDTSLGCPKPGMMYPQVLVEGIFVQLRANGQVYNYHGDGQRRLFLCDPQAGPLGGQRGRQPQGEP